MTTNTQHTSGPWHQGKRAAARAIYGDKGAEVCQMLGHFNSDEENLANARLIAAAPDLLASLVEAAIRFDYTIAALAQGQTVSMSSLQNCAAHARAAVAKALGN